MNPGSMNGQSYASIVRSNTNEIITDCYGVSYEVVCISGNGMCGYSSLSYCLDGTQNRFDDIILDCISVFLNFPRLLRERSDYGQQKDSNVDNYEHLMRSAIFRVGNGEALLSITDKICWCEDAHLIAISLLHDISIFVYDSTRKKWTVFNEEGVNGYICLHNSGVHFEVLQGIQVCKDGRKPAPIPTPALKVGDSRRTFVGWNDALVHVASQFSLRYVWKWPNGQEPVNSMKDKGSDYAQSSIMCCDLTSTENTKKKTATTPTRIFLCEHCPHIAFPNEKGLRMHQYRKHNISQKIEGDSTSSLAVTINSVSLADNLIMKQNVDCTTENVLSYDGKQQCTFCNKYFVNLLNHKICSKRSVSMSSINDINGSSISLRSRQNSINLSECSSIVGSNVADVEEQSLDASDVCSDGVSINNSFTNNSTNYESSKREQCQLCKNWFVNLSMHKKCRKMASSSYEDISVISTERVLRSKERCEGSVRSNEESDICSDGVSINNSFTDNSINYESSKREQCQLCKKWFVNLSMHKKCRKMASSSYEDISVISTERVLRSKERHEGSVQSNEDNNHSSSNQLFATPLKKTVRCPSRKQEKQGSFNVTNVNNNNECVDINLDQNANVEVTADNNLINTSFQNTNSTKMCKLKKQANKVLQELKKKYLPKKPKPVKDNSFLELEEYCEFLSTVVDNFATQRLSNEVKEVIISEEETKNEKRVYTWTVKDQDDLNKLNEETKMLKTPSQWTWSARDDSAQGIYNDERMKLCIEHELAYKIILCSKCMCKTLLVGLDQINSQICIDCTELNNCKNVTKKKDNEAWNKVKPQSQSYPKRTEPGHEQEDLPNLLPGDRAVIAPVHPVVTIKKNYIANNQLRQECISLQQDPMLTWSRILPRTDLKSRYMVIERRMKDESRRYIVANVDKVKQWLRYLFRHHPEFISKQKSGDLEFDEDALVVLGLQNELAEIDELPECDKKMAQAVEKRFREKEKENRNETGLGAAELNSGFSENHVFSFEKHANLYLRKAELLKIRKEGLIEIVEDSTIRKPIYCSSATLAFPYLYPNGEMSPLDFGADYVLSRKLLKKQAQFAHKMVDGSFRWTYAEDDIHMAHQYARLCEKTVHVLMGFYVSQHPETAHLPMNSVIKAFDAGFNEDGLLDTKLYDLTKIVTQIPNSREHWYAERLAIEAIARDMGSPNLFLTLNNEPRAWPDLRNLVYELEFESKMPKDHPFDRDTEKFTQLINKHAVFVSVYLCRKVKIMMRAFLCDICGISENEQGDWTKYNRTDVGYYWGRVEFTESRGIQHWHTIAKLPNVLDTALLGRIIQNGRMVRQEMKCGNIKPGQEETAWKMIKMGLMATRYVVLFADSISTASFYSEEIDVDGHDAGKVLDLEKYRAEFVTNYMNKNVNLNTHPCMRRFDDKECDPNQYVESAKVAAQNCMHHCMENSCGGKEDGEGCRFDFPKKKLNQTVVAVMQVNPDMMEARVLLRRTSSRVANLNKYFLRYWRANHDFTVLIDAAHSMRYVTKYAAKSGKYGELMKEMLEHLMKSSVDLLPRNIKHVLSDLVLADCSHRAFITKQELAYKVMNLPLVRKTFSTVDVIGFYDRANIIQSKDNSDVIVYNDRTEYLAYAERNDECTVFKNLSKDMMVNMNFNEFAETVRHVWVQNKKKVVNEIDKSTKKKFEKRIQGTGHWVLSRRQKRRHVRVSTVLNTDPAYQYEEIEIDATTTQTTFFELSVEKRKQLYRAYYELIMYVSWTGSPDESFLSKDLQETLKSTDPEYGNRYSLRRLEAFVKVYRDLVEKGEVAIGGSRWQRDNQISYTMFLTNEHNNEIKLDRSENKGCLKARFEPADELVDTEVDLRAALYDETDDYDFPSVLNFLPPDSFREIMEQKSPELNDIAVAFATQHEWQSMEELVMVNKNKRFMANPPVARIAYDDMTAMQKWIIDLVVKQQHKILYVCGKAGCGKTEVALKICEMMKGQIQSGACNGKAASNFNGPTVHAMFGWSLAEFGEAAVSLTAESKKILELRTFYEKTTTFIIDEVNTLSAAQLAFLHDTMSLIFNKEGKSNGKGHQVPFGGKQVIFLGDPAQLRPVVGPAIYDEVHAGSLGAKFYHVASNHARRTKAGQILYQKYLVPNCVFLQQGQRNLGILGKICDRIREGSQTEDDLLKLTCQRRKFPQVVTDCGIHYENDACSMHNWRQLWSDCKLEQKRLYVCKASYHTTTDNTLLIDGLGALPAKVFHYAPDVLCVSEGCEVRLVENINVSAGLVNSAIGKVVKVIYDNADVKALTEGKNPPPYCVIVDFGGFHGFLDPKDIKKRIFPFVHHHTWVPIYRKRFTAMPKEIPSWIRKKQVPKECYRQQFPLDLSSHITTHRAQGQTLSNSLVSVDLGLDNPDSKLSGDVSSVVYVALTRVTQLQNVFMSPVFPKVWEQIGKSEADKRRQEVEKNLLEAALKFAVSKKMGETAKRELAWQYDYTDSEKEWQNLQTCKDVPVRKKSIKSTDRVEQDFVALGVESQINFAFFLKPVKSERHIGIDQGTSNFAIVVVDKSIDTLPKIVEAENYDLQLKTNFGETDVAIALSQKTDLLAWMQQCEKDSVEPVDRVIVHLEQIAIQNKHAKQFGIELGRQLQRLAKDCTTCVVKLSHSHFHRAAGPTFKLGDKIVETLLLKPVAYDRKQKSVCLKRKITEDEEAETFGVSDYRHRKQMSARIFDYIVTADKAKLEDMKLDIDPNIQSRWNTRFARSGGKVKLDDVGDALLHALNDILCGSSNFKQLAPTAPSMHNNRTIAIAVFPQRTYWVVVQCTYNSFVIENFGMYASNLEDAYYKAKVIPHFIALNIHNDLAVALKEMDGGNLYSKVDHIKVIVKQQTEFHLHNLERHTSGTITTAATKAMKSICDEVMGKKSDLIDRCDGSCGKIYIRTDRKTQRKYQVARSTGKHTNAILSCINWFNKSLRDFVEKRRQKLDEYEKHVFFNALQELAKSTDNRMEMLILSDTAKTKLAANDPALKDETITRNFADLILIAINKNQQRVKVIAANSRKQQPVKNSMDSTQTGQDKKSRKRPKRMKQAVSSKRPRLQDNAADLV